jgi:hypothetical protein
VSERFSRKWIETSFTCGLVTPAGKIYDGIVRRPSAFTASVEVVWKQGIDALARVFSNNIDQMVSLFQDDVNNPRQFGSVQNRYSNCQRWVSVAGRRLATPSFVDFVKRIKVFPQQNGFVKGSHCN